MLFLYRPPSSNTVWFEYFSKEIDHAQTLCDETIIYHLYVSNTDKLSDISVPSIAISDHYPICFTRTSTKHSVKRQQLKTIQYCYNKQFNEQSFLNELSTALDPLILPNSDTNLNFENLKTIILKV